MCVDNLLHRARVERGLNLDEVAARTFLSPQITQALDAGRFDALPPGIYARSYVRAFATAVGLEPEQVVRELEAALPRVDDPLPVLRDIARGAAPDWPEVISGWSREATARAVAWTRDSAGALSRRTRRVLQQLTLVSCATGEWFTHQQRLLALGAARLSEGITVTRVLSWRAEWNLPVARGAAACLDAGFLLLLLALVVQLTAWTSGASIEEVLVVADEAIAALWGMLVLLYFLLLGGVGGRTPGAVLCGLPVSATDEPLRLRSILERAMLH